MIAVLIGAFGLIIGSFLNVVILRDSSTKLTVSTGRSVFKGRSRCFACGHILQWHELIPLVSFFIQKGKCRACKAGISSQYPIVELLTGIMFVLVWLKAFDYSLLVTGYWLLFFSLLIVISVYDFRTKIIPDRFVYPLIALGVGYALLSYYALRITGYALLYDALTALSAAAFFALLWLISQGKWIGFGDAKLTLGLGLFLGWPLILLALLFAVWSAAITGIGLILFKGYTRKSEIPFGPFLALGAFAAFLIGEKILLWYGGII